MVIMSEKICLQWNFFKENFNSAVGSLRNDKEFADVTLACEDGQQMEAHKVILATSSPFFEKILQKSKHPHPLIYLKGFQFKDFVSVLDFLYSGEANVYQEDLDSFLSIAEEIQLKGLTGQTSNDLMEDKGKTELVEPINMNVNVSQKAKSHQQKIISKEKVSLNTSTVVAIPGKSRTDLQALDDKVKAMMEKGQKTISNGKQPNGTPYLCTVCGKKDKKTNLMNHIEANHLEGICIPCDFCDKTFSSRISLTIHKGRFHK